MKHDITLPLAKAFINRAASLGYDVKMSDASNDPQLCFDAYLGTNQVCQFEMSGAMRFFRDNPLINERKALHNLLLDMKQAHDLYGDAPPFKVTSEKDFRLISSFENTVLAAKMSKDNEVRFNTWQYTYDRTAVTLGHYYETNYQGAVKDFALRAGLINEKQLFSEDELVILHDSCVFRGRNDDDITYDDERKLEAVMEKVESNIPNRIFDHEQEHDHGQDMEV